MLDASTMQSTTDYASKVSGLLKQAAALRVEANFSSEKIGAKIRSATIEKIPQTQIVGEKEQAEGKVAVRHRTEVDKGAITTDQFIEICEEQLPSGADRRGIFQL